MRILDNDSELNLEDIEIDQSDCAAIEDIFDDDNHSQNEKVLI